MLTGLHFEHLGNDALKHVLLAFSKRAWYENARKEAARN